MPRRGAADADTRSQPLTRGVLRRIIVEDQMPGGPVTLQLLSLVVRKEGPAQGRMVAGGGGATDARALALDSEANLLRGCSCEGRGRRPDWAPLFTGHNYLTANSGCGFHSEATLPNYAQVPPPPPHTSSPFASRVRSA